MALSLEESKALQQQFAKHIRNPEQHPAPEHIPDERMGVYRSLFFNSMVGFLDEAFPELRRLLGDRWRELHRLFYANHQAQTPYFHRISSEFLQFLQHHDGVPAPLVQLARYEQREYDVEVLHAKPHLTSFEPEYTDDQLYGQTIGLKDGVFLEAFEYDVVQLRQGAAFTDELKEKLATPQFCVFYRDARQKVNTMVIPPMTAALLELFLIPRTLASALETIAAASGQAKHNFKPFALKFVRDYLGLLLLPIVKEHP